MKSYPNHKAGRAAKAALIAALALAAAAPAAAGKAGDAAEFAAVARRVGAALRRPPRHRRLLGVSTLFLRGADLAGGKHVHLALFDLKGEPSRAARARVNAALAAALAAPWQLIAHRTSRYGSREAWIYARPNGPRMTTVVCLLQRGQATLVMANAKPQAILDSLQDRGIVLWSHRSLIRGLWGGLGDGSGFGPGLAFKTPSGPVNLLQLHGSAQVTSEGYFKSTLGFRFDPTGGDMRIFSLDLTGRYQANPDEDFFGVGPDSPAQRTMYDLQERGLALTFEARAARRLRFGAGEDYSGNRVFGGEDRGYANAQAVFSASQAPGLERGANLYSSFAFAEFDSRDFPRSPHRGVYLRLTASDNQGTGHSRFGYWHYGVDLRGYLPLTRGDVLAWRGLSLWNTAKAGEAIPFFRLARLGDSSILRGYRPYRFYGRNAVASSLEYRHYFDPDFGAFLFGDLGQVYGARSELTRANLRTTWGAGLLFNDGRRKTVFKLFFGVTQQEGQRWFLTLGPTF